MHLTATRMAWKNTMMLQAVCKLFVAFGSAIPVEHRLSTYITFKENQQFLPSY